MFNVTKNATRQLIAIVSAFVFVNAAAASSFEAVCADATAIDPNGSAWSAGYDETQIFNVDIASTGILVVDVRAPDSTAVSPRLIFLGRGCVEYGTTEDFATVEQGATYQVIAIRAPGTYSLRLASASIGQQLAEYEILSSFMPTAIVEEEVVLKLSQNRQMLAHQTHFFIDVAVLKSDEDVVDPNPDGKSLSMDPFGVKSEEDAVDPNPDNKLFGSGRSPILSLVTFYTGPRRKSDEDVVDPNPDAKSDEDVVAPNPDSKSDEDVVDPNPDSKNVRPDDAVVASLVLYSGEFSIDHGELLGGTTDLHNSRTVLLEWLAEMLQSGSAR